MSNTKYTVTQYSVDTLLGSIKGKEIAIPEIQRPFVWKPSKVRDLIDSLYNGYPTGYLIIWQNENVRLKDGSSSVGKKILIDGQQRVTALMAAIVGQKILTENYEEKHIHIAFNPIAEKDEDRFAVQTPAHVNSSVWISDISEVLRPDFDSFGFVNQYVANNQNVSPQAVNQAIIQFRDITNCQIGVINLVPGLDIGEVTEIFVRINSQGKRLNEADFAMSKIAADEGYGGNYLRKAIDYFCHLAVDPAFYNRIETADKDFMTSSYGQKMKWIKDNNDNIYDPDYNDMLRVSFMHQFNRGKLGDLVSLLSGRDFKEKSFKEEIVKDSFQKLSDGVMNFMNQYNFNQFVLAIKSAGFISSKLINSMMTVDFAYTLYLILQNGNEVPKIEIKRYIQKWFVLSVLTGRYVSSPESQMDRDLRGIKEKGFLTFFRENEESMLSDTFWNVRLVQNLETSSISSPYFNTYLAAQIFLGDHSLLSNSSKVNQLISVAGDIHHIFPKEYLKKNGFDDKSMYNQVANYTYLDTPVNIVVGKKSPEEYFGNALSACNSDNNEGWAITDENDFWENLNENCIPHEVIRITAADYPDFLKERRALMAKKIRNYYEKL